MTSHDVSTSGWLSVRKLGILLLVLSLAVGAGCTGVLDDGSSGNANLVDNVPEDQNVLVEVDMDLLEDDTTQRLFEQSGDESEEAPSQADVQAAFAYVEAETGLDPADVQRVLVFGQSDEVTDVQNPTETAGGNERVGILVSTDWSQTDVTAAFQNASESSLEEQSYDAQDGVFYRLTGGETDDDPSYLGVLGDGTFIVGDETSVRASLDTEYAGASSLSGDLRDAYENTRDGHVSAAVLIPEEDRSTQLGEMRAMTGVYYTTGDTVGFEGRLVTDSSDTAEGMKNGLDVMLAGVGDDPQMQELLNNLEISQSGSDVTFTYESDVETLLENAESA